MLPALSGLSGHRGDLKQLILATDPTNILAYFPMGEPSGTTMVDASGLGRNGVYTGVSLAQAGIGDGRTCPVWDGATSYGNFYSAAFAAAFNAAEITVCFAFQMASTGVWNDGVIRRLLTLQNGASNRLIPFKNSSGGNLSVTYTGGGTGLTKVTAQSLTDINWHFVVASVSKSADQLRLYVDAVEQGSPATGVPTWTGALSTTGCLAGASSTTPANVHSGKLAHLCIWKSALTPQQAMGMRVW